MKIQLIGEQDVGSPGRIRTYTMALPSAGQWPETVL
jgi:hypothetical protein